MGRAYSGYNAPCRLSSFRAKRNDSGHGLEVRALWTRMDSSDSLRTEGLPEVQESLLEQEAS